MRALKRNKQVFYYSNLLSENPITIDNLFSGEYDYNYSEEVKAMGNISASRGTTKYDRFGEMEDYDKVIVLDDPDFPIKETSRIRIGEDTYLIRTIARSLNSVSITIKKVV